MKKINYGFIILLIVSFIFMLSGLKGSLYFWDEAIYAEVSKEIVNTNDWMTLHWNFDKWFQKPPLYMWFTAISYKLFGISEFSARLGSALAGIGIVLIVYFFTKSMFNERSALISAFLLLSTTKYLEFSKMGMLDIPITFFIIASFYSFYLGIKENNYNKFIYSGIFFGFALMTKGVVGLLIPAIQVIFLIVSKNTKVIFSKKWLLSMLIGLVIALPWHVFNYLKYKSTFIIDYIVYHVIERAKGIEGNEKPILYYFKILINNFKPWFIILPFSIGYFIKKGFGIYKREFLFIIIWAAFVFIGFSFSKTKLPWYILPMFPACTIFIGHSIAEWTNKVNMKIIIIAGIIVMLLHIPFNRKVFSMDYTPELKIISLATKQESIPRDRLILSPDIHPTVPLFYSSLKTVQIKDVKEMTSLIQSNNRMFLLITKANLLEIEKYTRGKDIIITENNKYALLFRN